MKIPARKLRGGRDGGNAAMPRSNREEDRLVGCDLAKLLAKLLAKKERRFVEQRGELVEDMLPDVDVDGPGVVQAEQVLRQAADQKTRPRPIRERPARMELRRLQIAEGLEVDPGGAPAEQGARLPEHLPLHETEMRTANEQHDVAAIAPAPVPALLQAREKSGARGRDPLKLVEGEDELRSGMGGGPLLDHGKERLPPAVRDIRRHHRTRARLDRIQRLAATFSASVAPSAVAEPCPRPHPTLPGRPTDMPSAEAVLDAQRRTAAGYPFATRALASSTAASRSF